MLLFFFNVSPSSAIYTLSLHDALPISTLVLIVNQERKVTARLQGMASHRSLRSEEHTSELQSPYDLVCRLLLEKKKKLVLHNADHNNPYRLIRHPLHLVSQHLHLTATH